MGKKFATKDKFWIPLLLHFQQSNAKIASQKLAYSGDAMNKAKTKREELLHQLDVSYNYFVIFPIVNIGEDYKRGIKITCCAESNDLKTAYRLGKELACKENRIFFKRLKAINGLKPVRCAYEEINSKISRLFQNSYRIIMHPSMYNRLAKQNKNLCYQERSTYIGFDNNLRVSEDCKKKEIVLIDKEKPYSLFYPQKLIFDTEDWLRITHCIEIIPEQYMNKDEFKIIEVID